METAFRKIDIDAYDEDVLDESELYEPDPRPPAQVLSDARAKTQAVRGQLSKCVSFLGSSVSVFFWGVGADEVACCACV